MTLSSPGHPVNTRFARLSLQPIPLPNSKQSLESSSRPVSQLRSHVEVSSSTSWPLPVIPPFSSPQADPATQARTLGVISITPPCQPQPPRPSTPTATGHVPRPPLALFTKLFTLRPECVSWEKARCRFPCRGPFTHTQRRPGCAGPKSAGRVLRNICTPCSQHGP